MTNVPFGLGELLPFMDIGVKSHDPNAGQTYANCPFCGDNRPRLKLFLKSDTWKCFRCGQSGGMLELYARAVLGQETYNRAVGREAYLDALERLHLTDCRERQKSVKAVVTKKVQMKPETDNADVATRSRAYKALLKIDELALTDAHYNELKSRGFRSERMDINQYASFSADLSWARLPFAEAAYKEVEPLLAENKKLQARSRDEILAGLTIGMVLHGENIEMNGVPGFFKLGRFWCFLVNRDAIIIPLRNMQGQIIGLQYRLQSGRIRYMTVSSSGLPSGCSPKDQYHFPMQAEGPDAPTKVLLTEGPLKGDSVAAMLGYAEPILCILGVNNTSNLPSVLQDLKASGVGTVVNSLDMDRLLNKNVRRAVRQIAKQVKEAGMRFKALCWDEPRAIALCEDFQKRAAQADIVLPEALSAQPFHRLMQLAECLDTNKVDHPMRWDAEDAPVKRKGIDDAVMAALQ